MEETSSEKTHLMTTAFVPTPPLFTSVKPTTLWSVPSRHSRSDARPLVICSRRPPPPPRTHDDTTTQKRRNPLPRKTSSPPSPRLQQNVSRGRGGPAERVRLALRSRHDALILGPGLPGKLSAALSARERSEHALVLVPTRSDARRAAAEISLDARGSTIILAAGGGGDSWGHPAMNANSALKSVIVVATPRALAAEFCDSPHGRPWLSGVRFLALVDPHRQLDTGCDKQLKRIFKALRVRDHRKNVAIAMRKPEGDAQKLVESVLRENAKVDTIQWGWAKLPVQLLQKAELKTDTRVRHCEQFCESSTAAGVCARLAAVLRAHIKKKGKHKLVVFFPTARLAEYFALLFRARGFEILDIHGKTAPAKKEELMEAFFSAEKAIVFSSDTLARDTLLPRIDQVLQIGIPSTSEQYLRRVALVAAGGKDRYSALLLMQSEASEAANVIGEALQVRQREPSAVEDWVVDGSDEVPEKAKSRAYQSWLAYYRRCRRKIGWDRPELVRQANTWATEVLGEVPALDKKTIDKLFLRGIDGIRCVPPDAV